MKQSKLFTKTIKKAPKDEVSLNAQYLIRGGFINKEMAGVYSYLPLGLRVLKNIENIIREEMNIVGGIEMKTSVMQDKEVWKKSNRWDDKVVNNWFKTRLKNNMEVGLSFTNEETYSNILKKYVNSYKDLPSYLYDFKEIFRNEARSRSGILRGREFYWKALYSFSKDEYEHNDFYEKMKMAYKKVFNRVGIGHLTYLTYASGGTFSKYSHEFQTICEAGEDTIYIHKDDYGKGLETKQGQAAINKEIWGEYSKEIDKIEDFKKKKAIEVGNIFTLGTKFSEPFNLKYKNKEGEDKMVFMGSYGIGLSRLMGTIVEVSNDDKGIIWPNSVAPFDVHLINLMDDKKVSDKTYQNMIDNKIDVLYDDRDKTPGEKFADADLIGIPLRVVISEKTLAKDSVEIKKRNSKEIELIKIDKIIDKLKNA